MRRKYQFPINEKFSINNRDYSIVGYGQKTVSEEMIMIFEYDTERNKNNRLKFAKPCCGIKIGDKMSLKNGTKIINYKITDYKKLSSFISELTIVKI